MDETNWLWSWGSCLEQKRPWRHPTDCTAGIADDSMSLTPRFSISCTHVCHDVKACRRSFPQQWQLSKAFLFDHFDLSPGFYVSIWDLGILPLLQPQLHTFVSYFYSPKWTDALMFWVVSFSFVFLFVATIACHQGQISLVVWDGRACEA